MAIGSHHSLQSEPGIRTAEASNWRCSSTGAARTFWFHWCQATKIPSFMGVEWDFYGISMGDWREVYGIEWDISPASMKLRNKPFIHVMGRTWGYDGISSHEWYFQQHLRMSIFSGAVFHCPRCSRYGQNRGPKFHVSKATLSSLFHFFTPRWKIWILHPAIKSVNPKGPNSLDHPKRSHGESFFKKSGRSGRSGRSRQNWWTLPDMGGFHVCFQGKLLTRKIRLHPSLQRKAVILEMALTNITGVY